MNVPRRVAVCGVVGAVVLLGGCGTYYMVRDPATGNTYYTTDVDRAGTAGAVKFRDERSGSVVTLPKSEVREIGRYEYRSAVGAN